MVGFGGGCLFFLCLCDLHPTSDSPSLLFAITLLLFLLTDFLLVSVYVLGRTDSEADRQWCNPRAVRSSTEAAVSLVSQQKQRQRRADSQPASHRSQGGEP